MEPYGGEQIHLGRTGPFVPPITFPLASSRPVVVTDAAKLQLASASLLGIGSFRPVLLKKTVAVEWHEWDTTQLLTDAQLPFNGEPEEYILHKPHNIEISSNIEQLWTWHPSEKGNVVRQKGSLQLEEVLGVYDVFRLQDKWCTDIIVNENGMQVLSQIFAHWVTFREVRAKVIS